MASTAAPYQGGGWTDRLLNRGFAFVHIWSHFVQLAAFVAPPFYLLAKVLDLPIIPTGTAFGMGLNAGAACYCGAMEVLGATRDAGGSPFATLAAHFELRHVKRGSVLKHARIATSSPQSQRVTMSPGGSPRGGSGERPEGGVARGRHAAT